MDIDSKINGIYRRDGQKLPNSVKMSLQGVIYRYILENYVGGRNSFSANSVARDLRISPNTVNLAIRNLAEIGASSISRRSFSIKDFKKTLMYWAATRKLQRSISYSTFVGKGYTYLEGMMPGDVAFTAFSGYVNLFGNDVSDYGEVYVYATESATMEIMKRFPRHFLSSRSNYSDLIVLKPDKELESMIFEKSLKKSSASQTQICVDLWNIKSWQAPRFFDKIMERLYTSIKYK